MPRKPHVIKGNKTTEAPGHFVFLDTETKDGEIVDGKQYKKLRLGWACYWRRPRSKAPEVEEWLAFTDADAFWDWCDAHVPPRGRLVLIAHNLKFDIPIVAGFAALKRRDWALKTMLTGEKVDIWTVVKGNRSILCLDNYNFFHSSLAAIGKQIGLEKGKVDFDKATSETLSEYCRNDVMILLTLWRSYIAFLAAEDLGAFGKTVASQAFNAYRHRFMDHPITVHDHPVALALERASYRGGRSEPFAFGVVPGGPFYKLDVNSMYPYVMHSHLFPYRFIKYLTDLGPLDLLHEYPHQGWVAEVLLETDQPIYSSYIGGKLCFPVGRFWSVLPGPELLNAMEAGHVRQVAQAAVYEVGPLFYRFVNYWYDRRLEYKRKGDLTMEYFCKITMNSLYGKFGQRSGEWENVGQDNAEPDGIERIWNMDQKQWFSRRIINGLVQETAMAGESYHSFPAISAYVTSYARLYLWDLIIIAGRENVYYVDTDSLIVNQTGCDRLEGLMHPTRLGALKVEGVSENLELYGPKDYIFAGQTTLKGIRGDAQKIGDLTFLQTHFPGINPLLESGSINRYYTIEVIKTLSRDYTKGIVQADGRITPLIMEFGPEAAEAETAPVAAPLL